MKHIISFFFTVILFTFFTFDLLGCTSVIITGRLTADGRPLLMKHRDTGEMNNRIEFFKGTKYNFIGLVDSPSEGGVVWSGNNNAGFCIVNTASYNLKDDDVDVKLMDREGIVMYEALGICATLKDFENFLDNYPRPIGVEANFGVIDAEGGAAYYEVNNNKWVKYDVNDPSVAPDGYFIETNHSLSGRVDQGMGYIRYETAQRVMRERVERGGITPKWLFDNLSRCYYHSLLDIDLKRDLNKVSRSGWFVDQDFIPRKSTSASIVFQGVKSGENPDMTIMWTILGYPAIGVAVPLFVRNAENQPSFMTKSDDSENSEMCDLVLEIKDRVYSINRGNGNKYFDFSLLYNKKGKGYSQIISRVESKYYPLFANQIDSIRNKELGTESPSSLYNSYFEEFKSKVLYLLQQ